MSDSIKQLTEEIRAFSDARGWYVNQKVGLKGLAISISLEAAELLEHFQWTQDADVSRQLEANREDISYEIADVVIYALQFADRAGIDLSKAVEGKMEKNGKKYPAP